MLEYPILRGAKFENGNMDPGEQGPDRVVFIRKSDTKAYFCGAITHVVRILGSKIPCYGEF